MLRPLLAGTLALASLDASAESLVCTEIPQIPYTITAPGAYCLNKSLSTTQSSVVGITVNAHNVRLDCNAHQISNGNTGNQAIGIAFAGRTGVTIENCRIKGFAEGIHFDAGSSDIEIRGNKVMQAKTYGIIGWGTRVRIADNTVLDMKYADASRDYNQAIYLAPYAPGSYSWDSEISGNRILGVSGTSTMQGIRIDRGIRPIVRDNLVGGLSPKAGGSAYAIMVDGANATISDNLVTSSPAFNVTGIVAPPSSICVANILNGVTASGLASCGLQQGNAAR